MKTEYEIWQEELEQGPRTLRWWLVAVLTLGLVR